MTQIPPGPPWEELLGLVRAQVAGLRGRPRGEGVRPRLPGARRVKAFPLLPPPRFELDLARPEERLIVYGTLVPGGEYHYLVADLPEALWEPCIIRGRLGTYRGYPAFTWNPGGAPHPAWLVTSPGLPSRYPALDRFEGRAYRRRLIPAEAGRRLVVANIYEGRVRA